ncbi:vancomycin resistance protein [Paenibacillus sp. 1011MAR3C5]|uniref:VanW family protein n=1 Tax=Paenibacillus sp. 1011MAR3C5 TaxID=1675787 RepID=UPI000E6D5949|nr:VanW family protein [Paenibacillus sp. 1011MAR3C5]RJE90295.1 vancomycin resistance protein [Paenibacillus sp. 1011MAR3C5]
MKPIKRSKARIMAGTMYYRFRRHLAWRFSGKKFSRTVSTTSLPYRISSHQTPLLRQLREVDMSMQYNKIKNLKIALQRLNGIILNPGETFSYWRLIGKPTRRKGYVEGMILHYGSFKSGVGGGLCQLSNLLYWMTLHTPLTVVERHRHSYDVFPDANRTQPFGSGATCAYNYLDLQIYNATDVPYQLSLHLTDEYLAGEWRCAEPSMYHYEVYEREHRMSLEYWGGYTRHNQIYRRVLNRSLECIADEFVTENKALMMYEPLLEASGRGQNSS